MYTVGSIANRLGVSPFRVDYVIRSRGIRPAGRAGNIRVFDDEAVGLVELELQSIAGRRQVTSL